MSLLQFFWEVWHGKEPPVRVNPSRNDDLYLDSATRGTLVIGDPASGKTRYVAMQIFNRWKKSPHAMFVFDSSGGLTQCILELIAKDKESDKLLDKVVLDEIGNSEIVIPKPEFHPDYGLTDEEQVARVVQNQLNLAEVMKEAAGFLTDTAIGETGKNLFRLLQAIRNEYRENRWQITEALDLLVDENKLRRACKKFGQYAPPAKKYFENQYLIKEVPYRERELSTRPLRKVLGMIDTDIARATLGYYKPGWTPKEAEEKDLLVLIDAAASANLPQAKEYLITQPFSQVMKWVNKRRPDDPNKKFIGIYFDETVDILQIPGFARQLGMISPYYRSRKITLTIIIQALWQLDEKLAEQVWNMANVVSFVVGNVKDSKIIAEQLFDYDPKFIKNPAKTATQNNTTEPEGGQNRMTADWLQNIPSRSFVMRRYLTEQKKEKGVQFIEQTDDFPPHPRGMTDDDMNDLIDGIRKAKMKERGVFIQDALDVAQERSKFLDEDKSDPEF
jgi:hypothetical protein